MFTVTGVKKGCEQYKAKQHNREKNRIIKDGQKIGWMCELGLMSDDGKIIQNKAKKFKQINRFLEMTDDIEKYIPENAHILDMGCGKSYLTFAMYYYFNVIKGKNVTIKGLDLKRDVVEHCNELALKFGFDNLKFYCMDIADTKEDEKIDMMITLHACDTATDHALYHAVKHGCRVIMSVPCCQHELNETIASDELDIIMKHGILKERFAAIMTDAFRAEMLEIFGYKTDVMEFIDMEHTPKNLLIRAVQGKKKKDNARFEKLKELSEKYNVEPSIIKLFE